MSPALALATRALDPPYTPRPPGQSPLRLGTCHNRAWCLSPSPPPPDSPGEVTPKQCRGPPRRGGSLPSFTPPTLCPGESVYVPQFVREFLGAQRRWFVPGSHRQLEMKSPLNPEPPSKGLTSPAESCFRTGSRRAGPRKPRPRKLRPALGILGDGKRASRCPFFFFFFFSFCILVFKEYSLTRN